MLCDVDIYFERTNNNKMKRSYRTVPNQEILLPSLDFGPTYFAARQNRGSPITRLALYRNKAYSTVLYRLYAWLEPRLWRHCLNSKHHIDARADGLACQKKHHRAKLKVRLWPRCCCLLTSSLYGTYLFFVPRWARKMPSIMRSLNINTELTFVLFSRRWRRRSFPLSTKNHRRPKISDDD